MFLTHSREHTIIGVCGTIVRYSKSSNLTSSCVIAVVHQLAASSAAHIYLECGGRGDVPFLDGSISSHRPLHTTTSSPDRNKSSRREYERIVAIDTPPNRTAGIRSRSRPNVGDDLTAKLP